MKTGIFTGIAFLIMIAGTFSLGSVTYPVVAPSETGTGLCIAHTETGQCYAWITEGSER